MQTRSNAAMQPLLHSLLTVLLALSYETAMAVQPPGRSQTAERELHQLLPQVRGPVQHVKVVSHRPLPDSRIPPPWSPVPYVAASAETETPAARSGHSGPGDAPREMPRSTWQRELRPQSEPPGRENRTSDPAEHRLDSATSRAPVATGSSRDGNSWRHQKLAAESPQLRGGHSLGTLPTGMPDLAQLQTDVGAPYLGLTLRDAIEATLANSSIIRVLNRSVDITSASAWDGLIAQYEISAADGRFNTRLTSEAGASRVDAPPNTFFGPGLAAPNQRDSGDLNLRLEKPLRTGGRVSVGLEPPLAYLYFPRGVNPGEFNPAWSSEFVLRFRQPLLRGGGHEVATAPIQVAAIDSQRTQWEVQQELNAMLRSVSEAYWNLHAAYVSLQAVRAVIPLAEESVRIERLRLAAERTIFADLAKALYQLKGFQQDEAIALREVRRRTLQLRQLMGTAPTLTPKLLPDDDPLLRSPPADVDDRIAVAMQFSPVLNQLREFQRRREVELTVARNDVLPRLGVQGDYRLSGLADDLRNSLQQAATSDYTEWTVGLTLSYPIGNETARSGRNIAELQLVRERARTFAAEQDVAYQLTEVHSDLVAAWQRNELAAAQASDTQEWLRLARLRYSQPPASSTGRDLLLLELNDYQRAMRSWIEAVTTSGTTTAEVKTLESRLQEIEGTAVLYWTSGLGGGSNADDAPRRDASSPDQPSESQVRD